MRTHRSPNAAQSFLLLFVIDGVAPRSYRLQLGFQIASRSDGIRRNGLQPPPPHDLAHLHIRKLCKHGLSHRCAIRGCPASYRASRAHAALRLDLLHVKNLPLVENAKEDGLSKFVLQPVEIGPSTSTKIEP